MRSVAGLCNTTVFSESMFIDQATLNGTRPCSPGGVKPAMTPSECLAYGSIPCIGQTPGDLSVSGLARWLSLALVREIVGWVKSSEGAMSSVGK
jgi:hypothetical protein